MPAKNNVWSKKKINSSINPQGLTEDEPEQAPRSQFENRAKKKNQKI